MAKTEQKGAPVESLPERAKRLVRLAPKARKVVGGQWFFDGRRECAYFGETLVSLADTFEDQDYILDFMEAATPEVIKALALKALAYDALVEDSGVSTAGMSDATAEAMAKAVKATKEWK